VLARFVRLSGKERANIVRALFALTVVELGIRTLPLPRLAPILGLTLGVDADDSDVSALEPPDPELLWTVRSVASAARRWPFRDTCLRRALALGWLLRAREPTLRLGAMRTANGVRGHAWLEIDGRALDPHGPAAVRPLRRVARG
jgi:hypothetical protein